NAAYLKTKVSRMHHMLDLEQLSLSIANNGHNSSFSSLEKQKDTRNIPFVTLSYAQSIDGSIAVRRGEPLAISGPESLKLTHKLRSRHQGILIGIGTVLADDPQLTVRLVNGNDPRPIILDSKLRFPLHARLLNNSRKPWIFTAAQASHTRQAALESAGARVVRLPETDSGRVSLVELMSQLWQDNVHTLMVEGGASVISSFIAHKLVNHLVLTISPMFVGGLRSIASNRQQIGTLLPRIHHPRIQKLGEDIIVSGAFAQHHPSIQRDNPDFSIILEVDHI
ncbi:MAG: dihydrofolate reductase family protein, partial [Candidatus Promineifilaceae bacterium]|nr:dihydrofolate reductase family protein [Candidatus Promineifilaceae bacterium]